MLRHTLRGFRQSRRVARSLRESFSSMWFPLLAHRGIRLIILEILCPVIQARKLLFCFSTFLLFICLFIFWITASTSCAEGIWVGVLFCDSISWWLATKSSSCTSSLNTSNSLTSPSETGSGRIVVLLDLIPPHSVSRDPALELNMCLFFFYLWGHPQPYLESHLCRPWTWAQLTVHLAELLLEMVAF